MPKIAAGAEAVTPETNWQRIVIIDVHSMRGIKAGGFMDKSDPFYQLKCVPACYPPRFVSAVVQNSTEPTYDQRAIFIVPEGQDEIEFIARDYDGSGPNSFDELGRVNVKFALYEIGGRVGRQWFTLDTQGEVEMSMLVLNGENAANKIGELKAAEAAKVEALAAAEADDADDDAKIAALQGENARLLAELQAAQAAEVAALQEMSAAIDEKNEAVAALDEASGVAAEMAALELAGPAAAPAMAPPVPASIMAALEPFMLVCEANGEFLHLDGGGDKLVSTRYCQEEGAQDEFCHFIAVDGDKLQCVGNGEFLHLDGGGDRLVSSRYCQEEGAQDEFCQLGLIASGGSFVIAVKAGGFLHLDGGGDKLVSSRYCQGEGSQDEFCRFRILKA